MPTIQNCSLQIVCSKKLRNNRVDASYTGFAHRTGFGVAAEWQIYAPWEMIQKHQLLLLKIGANSN